MKQYIFESFASVAAFIGTIDARPAKEGWGHLTSQETGSYAENWTGTESYGDASKLALYGDKKSAEKVEKSIKKLRAGNTNTEARAQNKVKRSVIGSRPCVPAAIIGHPCSMYRRHVIKVNRPVVTVYYSVSMCGGTRANVLEDAGAKMAEAIQTVERSGVRVNLYVGNTSSTKTQSIGCFVRVKDSAKDFEVLRMAYALVNPSFFRRHWFHWAETKEVLKTEEWRRGYGCPLNENEEKQTLQKMRENNIKCDYLFTTSNICNMSADDIAEKILGK